MIYLASPYSSTDPLIRKTRFLLAEQVTAHFMRDGHAIFSPIVHCHEMAERHALPTDFSFWKSYCLSMLRIAEELWILAIPGWVESAGVTAEVEFAKMAGIQVAYVNELGRFIYENN